jgi:hypothetical protein
MDEKKAQPIKIEIQLDEDLAQGTYANLAVVNHSDAEFTLDFIFVQPQAPRAKVRSRVITSPRHVKRLISVLQENLARYEAQFGTVDVGMGQQPEPVGDYH